jgi:hypothetical protein
MPLFWVRIYVKVFVIPQIFSKSIDIWLWNFAHMFNIWPQPLDRRRKLYQSFWQNYCPFLLRIYIEVCIPPQIYSYSIDIWLWNQLKFYTLLWDYNRTLSKAYNCNMDLKKNVVLSLILHYQGSFTIKH